MKAKSTVFKYEAESDERLDKLLLEHMQGIAGRSWSRSQIKNLIEDGKVTVSGKQVLKAGSLVRPGAWIELEGEEAAKPGIEHWEKKIPVIFEDKYLIVVNKPPFISMHPGAGRKNMTLVNALSAHFSKDLLNNDVRAGVVHRLDKDTSGIVVLAKNVEIHEALSRLFAERTIKKTYVALVLSTPRSKRLVNKQDEGLIETNIDRDPKARIKMSVSGETGRKSATKWKVKERMFYACLVEIGLLTGRTHQIRVHFDHISSPVIGDKTYGNFSALPLKLKKAAEEFGRQALHAKKLEFIHPVSKKLLKLQAPLPEDMQGLIDEFRKYKQ